MEMYLLIISVPFLFLSSRPFSETGYVVDREFEVEAISVYIIYISEVIVKILILTIIFSIPV